MTQAEHAVRAAKNYHRWGRRMAVAYVTKRGIPRHLLTIAVQLERTKRWA